MVVIVKGDNGSVDQRQKIKSDGSTGGLTAITARQTMKNGDNNTTNTDNATKSIGTNRDDGKNTTSSSDQQQKTQPKNSEKTAANAASMTQNDAVAADLAAADVAAVGEVESPKSESDKKSIDPIVPNNNTEQAPVIRLRQKGANSRNPRVAPAVVASPRPPLPQPPPVANKSKMQLHEAEIDGNNGLDSGQVGDDEIEQLANNNGGTAALIQRTMGSLYEASPDMEDNTEEIRKLDSQLDHLNEYMDKVEERLKTHSEKLMETLKQQKEEREKRRRSFHERLDANRQEDDDFQRQLSQILNRVDISLKRQSACDIQLPPMPVEPNATENAENH